MTANTPRAIDVLSRLEAQSEGDSVPRGDLLLWIFAICHPLLLREERVALTLQVLGEMTVEEIARAFLVPEATIAKRIRSARRRLIERDVPFELPGAEELPARLESALEVIYLVFNEGYTASVGDEWMRPGLCEQALRWGRTLAERLPAEPEVHGLVALMELQASRTPARVGPSGQAVLLPEQDRSLWDAELVQRGLASLIRGEELARGKRGPYLLQAAIAACHARAPSAAETDWERIVALYSALAERTPSPIVELNRAVAIGMAFGPEAALELVDRLAEEPSLSEYPFLPSVRADLLARLGRFAEARVEIERALPRVKNARDRALLLERAASYARRGLPS